MELLRAHGIAPAGRRVTVVGRSLVIGRPAALLLTRADATVTLCHRKTPDLAARCRAADILLAAARRTWAHHAGVRAPGADRARRGRDRTVRWHAARRRDACGRRHRRLHAVPGGIGSVTTALLLRHTVQAAEKSHHF